MPKNIKKRTARTRTQTDKDKKIVFGYEDGPAISVKEIPEDVQLSKE